MQQRLMALWNDWLNIPLFSRIRRNHGLEHATLHVLAEKNPKRSLAGHSDVSGFWILGDVSTQGLQDAVAEALHRLQSGEQGLAVHPNCGTNFATAGVLAGLSAALAMVGAGSRWRDKVERLPLAITLATLALIIAQPLGLRIQQQVTTQGNPQQLEVVEIIPSQRGRLKAHRVITAG